jgi:hypothetical protein
VVGRSPEFIFAGNFEYVGLLLIQFFSSCFFWPGVGEMRVTMVARERFDDLSVNKILPVKIVHASEGHHSAIDAIPWDCLIVLICLQVVLFHGIIIALSYQTSTSNYESCNQKGMQKSIIGSHCDGCLQRKRIVPLKIPVANLIMLLA